MEPLRTQLKLSRRAVLSGMALAALSPVACLGKHFVTKTESPPPPPKGRVVAIWKKEVSYAGDPNRGGALYPGLNARVYVFGPDLTTPYHGDGYLRISIYDASGGMQAEPKLTDIVDFPKDALARTAETDFLGKCHTIFCPWFNYRPDISHVYITLEYVLPTGEKLEHQSGNLSVDHAETLERMRKGMPAYHAKKD